MEADPIHVEALIEQVKTAAVQVSPAKKLQLLAALRGITSTILTPEEQLIEKFSLLGEITSTVLAYQMGALAALVDSPKPLTTEELAKKADADQTFASRILRFLAAVGVITEVREHTWSANDRTKTLLKSGLARQFQLLTLGGSASFSTVQWVETHGFKTPESDQDCPWTEGQGRGVPLFEHFRRNPKHAAEFSWAMESVRVLRVNLCEVYPFKEQITSLAPERVALVDVGGGYGHMAEDICKGVFSDGCNEDQKNRFVCQDLDYQIEIIREKGIDKQRPCITFQSTDFFEEQKVRGAKFYFFRHIFHDHSDQRCRTILEIIRDAMSEDSSIIIDDLVLPNVGVGVGEAAMDLAMMSTHAGKERSEAEWHMLVDSVEGLELKKLWKYGSFSAGLVEIGKRS